MCFYKEIRIKELVKFDPVTQNVSLPNEYSVKRGAAKLFLMEKM